MLGLLQVLQDSLCGSSKVMLVCNLSPEAASASETLSSLNFAARAAQVELGPAKRGSDLEQPGAKSGNTSTPGSRRCPSLARYARDQSKVHRERGFSLGSQCE